MTTYEESSLKELLLSYYNLTTYNEKSDSDNDIDEVFESLNFEYYYLKEKGYIYLSNEAILKHNITQKEIKIYLDDECIGGMYYSMILKMVGFDTMILNEFHARYKKGYMFNKEEKQIYDMSYTPDFVDDENDIISFIYGHLRITILLETFFVLFACMVVVMKIFKETLNFVQSSMFTFRTARQHFNAFIIISWCKLILIYILVLSAMADIMYDALIVFMLCVTLWVSMNFMVTCARTKYSIRFFPHAYVWYLICYFYYIYSNSYGFDYIAFFAFISFVSHAIIVCFNRFEIPAIQSGVINPNNKRELSMGTISFFVHMYRFL
eukprot:TRINITY_DN3975_c0_g1_i2.p1 TRINITY_DN3975_c0_g1~~TRINITY_DN3975_c0_g1_i2.p1  ORF type:complete len:323 (+),score=31.28 TRINITY_DN3975_c0_g1_i2:206-1174(+)